MTFVSFAFIIVTEQNDKYLEFWTICTAGSSLVDGENKYTFQS